MSVGVSAAVLRTACDSFMAKLSFVEAGYETIGLNGAVYARLMREFGGELVGRGVATRRRSSALVNLGYAIRVGVITREIERFVRVYGGRVNIVMVGCGVDVLGLWACSLSESVQVVELDDPTFVDLKGSIYASVAGGRDLDRITGVGLDLQDIDEVEGVLRDLKSAKVDVSLPTLILR